jgi:cell division protein FtsL
MADIHKERRSMDQQDVEPNKWSTKKVVVVTAITAAVATIVIVVVLSIIVQLILHGPGAG